MDDWSRPGPWLEQMLFPAFRPETWELTLDLVKKITQPPFRWAFRGHSKASWRLETSLEREAKRFDLSPSLWAKREALMLRQFQRRAHHYIRDVPEDKKSLE